jgi:hypothetical protein
MSKALIAVVAYFLGICSVWMVAVASAPRAEDCIAVDRETGVHYCTRQMPNMSCRQPSGYAGWKCLER